MDSETIGALVLNAAAYASVAAGAVQLRRQRPPKAVDGADAFRLLEVALKRSFPDLPMGFTLREGLARARLSGLDLGWDEIERKVTEYEAFRYGEAQAPALPQTGVMSLVDALWRRE
jgi:hypothetical protein